MGICDFFKRSVPGGSFTFCTVGNTLRSCGCEGDISKCERHPDDADGHEDGETSLQEKWTKKELAEWRQRCGSGGSGRTGNWGAGGSGRTLTSEVKPGSKEVKKVRQEVLEKAIHMVCGDRNKEYGEPEDSFSVIAGFWEVYIKAKCASAGADITILPEDVAALMVLFKMARIATGQSVEDSWVDGAGYCANGAELQQRREHK